MNKRIILFFIGICFLYNLHAQDTSKYDLKRCIEFALENSYLNQSTELEATQLFAEYKAKKSKILPQIDFYLGYHNYFNDLPTYIFPSREGSILSGGSSTGPYPVELGLPHNLNTGINIDQLIFDRNFILTDDFNRNIEKLNSLQSQLTRETIIYDITSNYYKLASLYSKRELLNYNLERLSRIEKLVDVQIENGFARNFDRGKVEINRTQLLSGIDQLEAGILQMEGYMKFLMGMPVDADIDIMVKNIEINPGKIDTEYQDNSNTVQEELLDTKIDLLELEKENVKSDYFLKLKAFAQFRVQAQREAFNFFEGNQDWFLINLFGVRLDIPVYQGGKKRKQMETSSIRSAKVKLDKIRLQENLKMQFENSRLELANSVKSIEYNKENVETSKRMYEQTSAMFEEGLIMLTELLEVESIYREAENNLITARYGYKIAELNYLKSTGNLLTYTQDL